MKIFFVIRKLAGRSGGAERILIETANRLSDKGHRVEIISYEPRRGRAFYPISSKIRHTNLYPHKSKIFKYKILTLEYVRKIADKLFAPAVSERLEWMGENSDFIARLKKHIKTRKPDALVPFMPPAITAAVSASKKTRVAVIASTHNEPSQDFRNVERWSPNPLDQRLRREATERSTRILVLLPEYKAWYPDNIHDRIDVIGNPVEPVPDEMLSNASRQNVILSVGRLANVKRHQLLIDAWSILHKEFPDWAVHIYGVGPNENELSEQITRHELDGVVVLKGHTLEIQKAYLAARLLAHPAEFEGFPLAVTEALANGLPVVGFEDCSGLNRLVEHGVNGLLVPATADRLGQFVSTMRRLLSDSELMADLSRAAPSTMLPYSPQVILDKWEESIRMAVRRKKRRK